MQITKYYAVVHAIKSDDVICQQTVATEFFRWSDSGWFALDGSRVLDERMIECLNETKRQGSSWRPTASKNTFFPMPDLDAVVVAQFSVPVRKERRSKLADIILRCQQSGIDKFNATHNVATGLLNRESFDRELIKSYASSNSPISENESVESNSSLCVVAIDIDHFKQINDTYGHGYGDIVLQALARRLLAVCNDVAADTGVTAIPAHPSGEEFLVLLRGGLGREDEQEMADRIRRSIGDRPMPDDAEWRELARSAPADSFVLPHVSERRVSVSFGYASLRSVGGQANVEQRVLGLKKRADIALHRAKLSGRNCTIGYEDILAKHGRVLEHHPETDIVAIDIGSNVDLKEGQEFLVFHPQFSGSQPLIHNDGRTHRHLGIYPKVESGRLEVFDVQAEVAFCRVHDNALAGQFPIGARLEAVPLGSISHLVGDRQISADGLLTRVGLQARVEQILTERANPFSLVFFLTNSQDLSSQSGVAFANKTLATLFAKVRSGMPSSCAIGQVQPTQIACVGIVNKSFDVGAAAKDIAAETEASFQFKPTIKVGIFLPKNSSDEPPAETVVDKHLDRAIDFATYAATSIVNDTDRLVYFGKGTPARVLLVSRRAKLLEVAQKDFSEFEGLGLISDTVVNQMMLMFYEMNMAEEADKIVSRFIDHITASDDMIVPMNGALVKYKSNKTSEALALAELALTKGDIHRLKRYSHLYLRTLALILLDASETGEAREALMSEVITEALNLPNEAVPPADRARMERALERLGKN